MRSHALLALLFSMAAFILGFLCIFAGSKTTFMPSYPIMTVRPPFYTLRVLADSPQLNTSRIGQNFITSVVPSGGTPNHGGFLSSLLHNITSSVEGDIAAELSSLTSSLAHAVG